MFETVCQKSYHVERFELPGYLFPLVATVLMGNSETSDRHVKTCNMPKRWQNGICSR